MKRTGFMLYGGVAYIVFLLTFLYLVAFVAALPLVPRTIDFPASAMPAGLAMLVDLALVALFGVQHSVMARAGFKAAWTRIVPPAIERSSYMICACLALILLFVLWQPLPAWVWDVRDSAAAPWLWALAAAGWAIVLLSTFMISHFELFGLVQVWDHWRGAPAKPPSFRHPLFYRLVRHPLYSGFLIAFWVTPAMSYGHLLFAPRCRSTSSWRSSSRNAISCGCSARIMSATAPASAS
ncbi:isoprenylcysteine carboxylmethyltransferase family protein [Sphingomonas quercus]|uniref:Isoprenylcysteine carboxylmethyltransferase family protein n=1 Tax=Sphingomonas quercus TaxID=2842451 RepID=A0ABS6BIN6_9SPHN|nr:isoprenylcysteine carboxylmethyltransferase family protein [Sphingomonas quercus]MBU3077467.1 isoprenylcysteine carboxylmethyltransferase family protein [Sphingomonas quercus]